MSSLSYLVEEMLLANSSNFANVVDKANIPFCCSVAFADTNVPKPLQEVSPGVGPYPVPQSQSDFMISVVVFLEEGEGQQCVSHAHFMQNYLSL